MDRGVLQACEAAPLAALRSGLRRRHPRHMVAKRTLKTTVAQACARIRPHAQGAVSASEVQSRKPMLIISFLAILVLLFLLTGVRIANQYERAVIFRLGQYIRH